MKKRISQKIMMLITAGILLCGTGCSSLKDIRNINIASANIENISLEGSSSIGASISVTVENPAKEIAIQEFSGTVYRSGKAIGTFEAEPFAIEGRTTSKTVINGVFRIDPSVSPMVLMSIATNFRAREFTLDLDIKAGFRNGVKKRFSMEDIPLESLMKNFNL